MRERLRLAVRSWIPIAIAVTAMSLLAYLLAQQTLRMSLNDPQAQLAQDVAARLVDGAKPKEVVGGNVDIAASLAPWAMLYDDAGKPLYGGATLEGTAATPPHGVFEAARTNGENRVTWQPRDDVRVATVITYWRGESGAGFVVAGRNMREVEQRVDTIGKLTALGLLAALAATLAAAFVLSPAPPAPEE